MDFKDQVAVVTGSSRGIGRSVVIGLSQRGAKVVINYRASMEAAQKVAEEINNNGGDAIVIKADMADPTQIHAMINQTIQQWGRIDVLVNNAAFSAPLPLKEITEDIYQKTIQINQHGVVTACRAVIPQMQKQGYGRIVNISSIGAQIGCSWCFPYCVTKNAVIGITRALAFELAQTGITVNTVSPGSTDTEMLMGETEERRNKFMELIPMKRFGTPDELAYGIIFLASKGSSYITGQVLSINGGQFMSG